MIRSQFASPLTEPRIIFLNSHVLSLMFSTLRPRIMRIFESARQTSGLEANLRESRSPIFLLGGPDFKRRAREAERDSVYTWERPYLAFFLKLDMGMVRDVLHSDEVSIPTPPAGTSGMVLGKATVELLAPCCRMVQILDTPQDVPFFGKLLEREIIYRLLQGPQGDRLRSVATLADQNYRTAKAVNWLREHYEKTLNVDDLASITGMSRSTLHHHFRSLTAMSPLQFQKQLRLHAARQKMLTGELDAASAAFEVGYESPSQFNREYKRFFGQPPMRDIHALRASV